MKLTVEEVFDRANSCSDHVLVENSAEYTDGVETLLALGSCGCTKLNEEYDT